MKKNRRKEITIIVQNITVNCYIEIAHELLSSIRHDVDRMRMSFRFSPVCYLQLIFPLTLRNTSRRFHYFEKMVTSMHLPDIRNQALTYSFTAASLSSSLKPQLIILIAVWEIYSLVMLMIAHNAITLLAVFIIRLFRMWCSIVNI